MLVIQKNSQRACITSLSLIMIIIGSNIARAFALVGAMSIVRFRNPIKETMDLVYIFSAIAIGMAIGTGFLYLAVTYLVVFVGYLFFVKFSGFGARSVSLSVIRMFGSFDWIKLRYFWMKMRSVGVSFRQSR